MILEFTDLDNIRCSATHFLEVVAQEGALLSMLSFINSDWKFTFKQLDNITSILANYSIDHEIILTLLMLKIKSRH